MSSGQIVFLGAVAGLTIFLGLPVGRMQSISLGTKSFLSAMATGILLFLLWDVLTAAVEPVEGALTDGNDGRFLWLAMLLTGGFAVGLLEPVQRGAVRFPRGRAARAREQHRAAREALGLDGRAVVGALGQLHTRNLGQFRRR
jgi:ZIP family zinc transporter